MLTYRKLFTMLLMMTVVLALYMLTQTYREIVLLYDAWESIPEAAVRSSGVWESPDGAKIQGRHTVLIGDRESGMGRAAAQWCVWGKRSLESFGSLAEYLEQPDGEAQVLCIDSSRLSLPGDAALLAELAGREMVIVFGGMPGAAALGASPELRRILGIEQVLSDRTELFGLYLSEGFLLGGEAICRLDGEDPELNAPWYRLGSRTKTYLSGLTGSGEEAGAPEERLPVVWRNTLEKAQVFAVNGDYLDGLTGPGLLDAMLAQSGSYVLYPVVNAQNLTVADYPSFTPENEARLEELYANNHKMLLQNIIWPGLVALCEQTGFQMTCFMTPQIRYSEEYAPQADNLTYYLRQLTQHGGEAGWSAGIQNTQDAAEKWKRDQAFFREAGDGLLHTSVCVLRPEARDFLPFLESGGAPEVRTVTGLCGEGEPLLAFAGENLTFQGITHRAAQYGFRDELKNRSLQTALGYTNILVEMDRVTWLESEADQWENYFKAFSRNIGSQWTPFSGFERTSLTESDSRVRSFLALDYETRREGDVITLNVENRQGTVSFLLRTRGKEIKSVSGGTAAGLEEGVWLLSVQADEVRIELESR
ncbi:MAG: DUF2194 domain-containing protein [Lawsonibacter sp.]|nr:DUF2194 domain-containing protein [Lawsonibacter sp.]